MALGIAEFGVPSIELLERRLNEELAKLGAELGITIETIPRSFRYTKDKVEFKVESCIKTEAGKKSREQVDFEAVCHQFGLQPSDYRMSFIFGGKHYKLVGLGTQAVKYPFHGENANGKVYKLPPSAIPVAAAKAGFGPRVPLFGNVPPETDFLLGDDGPDFDRRMAAAGRAMAADEVRGHFASADDARLRGRGDRL